MRSPRQPYHGSLPGKGHARISGPAEPRSQAVCVDRRCRPDLGQGRETFRDSVFLPAMSMEVALARRAAIVEFTRRIMVKDRDFGEIPGTHKPTLLKPGAEKLCNFFGLEPEFTPIVEDIDWTGAQHGGEVFCYARYRCRLLREGRVVGVGEGSCNSWEAKYRYRWVAEEQVPEHLDRTQSTEARSAPDAVRVRFCDRARRNHRNVWQAGRALAEVPGCHPHRYRASRWRNSPGAASRSPGKSTSTRRSTAFPIPMWRMW